VIEDVPAAIDVNVDDEAAVVIDAGLGWTLATVVDTGAVGVADGIAMAAGVGSATEPGNSVSGVGAAIGPAVGDGLATAGVGMGVGGAVY
jgi:hypothetical protein